MKDEKLILKDEYKDTFLGKLKQPLGQQSQGNLQWVKRAFGDKYFVKSTEKKSSKKSD